MFISIDITLSGQGERLSHAVGCAFAVCLERKQKRDKDCAVSMNFDNKNSTFTRLGSFRQATITERLQDPQMLKPSPPKPSPTPNASSMLTPTNDSVEKRLSADSRYALTNLKSVFVTISCNTLIPGFSQFRALIYNTRAPSTEIFRTNLSQFEANSVEILH